MTPPAGSVRSRSCGEPTPRRRKERSPSGARSPGSRPVPRGDSRDAHAVPGRCSRPPRRGIRSRGHARATTAVEPHGRPAPAPPGRYLRKQVAETPPGPIAPPVAPRASPRNVRILGPATPGRSPHTSGRIICPARHDCRLPFRGRGFPSPRRVRIVGKPCACRAAGVRRQGAVPRPRPFTPTTLPRDLRSTSPAPRQRPHHRDRAPARSTAGKARTPSSRPYSACCPQR